jgi:hypothetical protein
LIRSRLLWRPVAGHPKHDFRISPRINHNTDEVFLVTLVQTPRRPRGGRITFAVSTRTRRTTLIGVPFIAFCE